MSIYEEFDLLRDALYNAEWNRYEGLVRKVVEKCDAIMDNHSIYEPYTITERVPNTNWYVVICTGMIENIIFEEHIIVFDSTKEN